MSEETINDALKWVEALILHYQGKYISTTALEGVLSEIRTCIALGELPELEGTRFKEATQQLQKH